MKNSPKSPREDGFFRDHLLSFKTDTPFSRAEAFVGILVAALVGKGEILANARIDLFYLLRASKTLRKFSGEEISLMMQKMFSHKEAYGFDSLLDHAIAFYAPSRRRSIYKDACKVIFFIKEENSCDSQFLDELQVGMGMSPLRSMKIRSKVKLNAAA